MVVRFNVRYFDNWWRQHGREMVDFTALISQALPADDPEYDSWMRWCRRFHTYYDWFLEELRIVEQWEMWEYLE